VLTLYPGMPADVIERDMTSRLERWTGQANGIARQESKSMVGVSILRDYFREDIDPNTAMAQVTSLAMSDLYYLPPGTIPPMVMPFDPTASIPLCLIGVSSSTFDETKLYDVAYFDLRNRLQGITGVIAPAVYGGKLRRILAYVDREKAQARGLSPLDVIHAIQGANTFIPTGDAKFGRIDYQTPRAMARQFMWETLRRWKTPIKFSRISFTSMANGRSISPSIASPAPIPSRWWKLLVARSSLSWSASKASTSMW